MANGKKEDEALDTLIIPENFVDTGRCFNGMFRTRNLVEGVAFAALPAFLIIQANIALQQKIIIGTVVVGIIMALTLNGINGDSFLEFIYHAYVYHGRKRVAKYNPRVKMEATPGYLTEKNNELPRDKIIRLYNEFRNRNGETEEEAVSRDIYDPMYIEFFKDDLGVVKTPDDLKSKKQLREEARERKRIEKKSRAEKKAALKAAKKEAHMRNKEELREIRQSARENKKAIKDERKRLKREARELKKRGRDDG